MATILANAWEKLTPEQKAYFVFFSTKLLVIANGVRRNGCGVKDVDVHYFKVRHWIEKDFLAMIIGSITPVEFLIEYYGISCEYSHDPEYIVEQVRWFNHYADRLANGIEA